MQTKEKTNLRPGKGAKKLWAKLWSQLRRSLMALAVLASATMACFAEEGGSFGNSSFAKGTINLINDVSTYLMIIGPIAGTMAAGYFLIRRAMADETDGKMWMKRVFIAGGCGIGVLLVGGIITMVTGYYK